MYYPNNPKPAGVAGLRDLLKVDSNRESVEPVVENRRTLKLRRPGAADIRQMRQRRNRRFAGSVWFRLWFIPYGVGRSP